MRHLESVSQRSTKPSSTAQRRAEAAHYIGSMGNNNGNLVWDIAELLRGEYKQADYGKVILPFTVLRRLDSVLRDTKPAALAEAERRTKAGISNLGRFLPRITGFAFYNTSTLDFEKLLDDPSNIARNMRAYIEGFSENVRTIFEEWKFGDQIDYLARQDLLYRVVQRFAEVDLHPDVLSNHEMGLLFEDLIRRFAELSNETAGEHFTPREVVHLAVDLLFAADDQVLTKPGIIRSVYDPTAGTGGMLSVSEEHVTSMNAEATIRLFGQELNPESHAICMADMLVKGQDPDRIVKGNTLSADGHRNEQFDYMLANPPFGVNWSKVKPAVKREHQEEGYAGRFGPGLPRVTDGSLLFLMHMLSKMNTDAGSRIGIVFNGSPLFTGGAGGGESEIRRWIIENDWLEAIVGLPTEMFYNTGIATYIWILTNRKDPDRKGKIQLIDASDLYEKMPKSLGEKRKYLAQAHIDQITRIYGEMEDGGRSKVVPNEYFGYRKITVDRPLRVSVHLSDGRVVAFREACKDKKEKDLAAAVETIQWERGDGPFENFNVFLDWVKREGVSATQARKKLLLGNLADPDPRAAPVVKKAYSPKKQEADPLYGLFEAAVRGSQGIVEYESDSNLRDYENVPLSEDVEEFFRREVLPYVEDAWIDPGTVDHKDGQAGKVGYEINFTREFCVYEPPRPTSEVKEEIRKLESEIVYLLREVAG